VALHLPALVPSFGPAAQEPALPPVFGDYCVDGALAAGGMGVLYRARHRETGHPVAIKTVVTDKEVVLSGIRSEIRALARLVHPGVARIVDEGIQVGHPWYAMELVEGETLARFRDQLWQGLTTADLTTDVGLPEGKNDVDVGVGVTFADRPAFGQRPEAAAGRLQEILLIVQRLCAPLAYVHGRGIVHRDLKPENVLLRRDGTPVLIDFGVAGQFPAALARETLEPSSAIAGTVAYMAPEQFRRGAVDARADLFSLGCMLYELICGRRPFLTNTAHLADVQWGEPPLPPSSLVDGVSPALDAVILRLLARRPRDRIGYASDVAEALSGILADQRVKTAPATSAATTSSSNLLAVGTVSERAMGGFYLYRPEMVGRQEPLEALKAAIETAIGGEGATFFLGGESGIGKTMLAGEIGKHAVTQGMRVVTGECLGAIGDVPQPGSRPLAAFRRFLQSVADQCRVRGEAFTRQLFGTQTPLLARVEPALADLPGLTARALDSDLTGEAARSAILTGVADLIFAFCHERPLLLILDDVQWADELSLAVFKLLAPERLAKLPLLVFATYRTDEVPAELRALITGEGRRSITLDRLDEAGVGGMVTEMLGMSAPPSAMVRFLAKTSEGNPFFVAEYVRAAVSDGVLVRRGGRWQLTQGIANDAAYESLPLPNSLRGLIQRRMRGFSPAVSGLLDVASVIGRTVDPTLLTTISGQDSATVHDGLAELRSRQVIEERGGQLQFVHEKLREHAYQSIAAPARRALHLKVAEALEADGARDAHTLAFHFHTGGRPDRALDYAVRAGEQSFAAGALFDAHDHLTRALALEAERDAASPQPPPLPPLQRARLRRVLGDARAGTGDVEGGEALLREAFELCGVGRLPRRVSAWGVFLLRQLFIQMLNRWLPASFRKPVADSARWEAAAVIANRVGFVFMVSGRHLPMLGILTCAANLAEKANVPAPRGIPYSILAGAFGVMRAKRLSQRYFEASRRVVAESRDLVAPLQQAQIEGFYYLNCGDWDAARAVLEPAFVQGKALGIPYELEALGIARATVEIMTGQPARARALLSEVRSTAEALGNRLHEWWARRYEALALLQEGQPREALAIIAPAEAGFRERGVIVDLINVLAMRATAHQRLGEREQAMTCIHEAFDLAMRHPGALPHCFEFHTFAAEVFLRAFADARVNAKTSADALAKKARLCLKASARFARMFPIGLPSLLFNQARLHHILGRDKESRQLLQKATTVAASLGMPLDPVL
jgi:serine/threonine protein kinase/tetratricopeptide (TPR) repeat protein